MSSVISASKNIIRNLLLAFLPLLTFFTDYFLGFQKLNTYTAFCLFVDRVKKYNCYIFVRTWTTENISDTLFVVQNIQNTFPLTLRLVNMLRSTFFVICFLFNTLFLLFFAIKIVISSAAPILLHFYLEKHHSQIDFSLLTTVDAFNAYLEVFER